jgi:hypothetical protein
MLAGDLSKRLSPLKLRYMRFPIHQYVNKPLAKNT